jgi:hypothetical protein
MQSMKKWAVVAAATCGLGLALSSPSMAQGYHRYYTQGYSVYQNPDGSYDSMADLSRDIRGIPCGIECTQESHARWAHYGTRHYHDYGY